MGTESIKQAEAHAIVADAGPLIHLDELDALDVISDFHEIVVGPIVHEELRRHRPLAVDKCPQLVFSYTPLRNESVDGLALRYALHRGEREALALCLQLKPALLLTDDTAARLAAKELGVIAHGTIGLLIRSVRKQHRSPESAVELLGAIPERSTLHIRPALLQEVIDEAKRNWAIR